MTDETARAHYAQREDPDSQTAPGEVRKGLERFLADWPVEGPLLDVGSGVGGNLPVLAQAHAAVGAEISLAAAREATLIVDGNHKWRDPDVHMLDQGYDFTPIDIGDGAIVLTKSTVFASLGERSIVGAHSLVNRPVPAYCFAAGTPAKVREYYGHPENRPAELDAS